jgi:hypothetical protein
MRKIFMRVKGKSRAFRRVPARGVSLEHGVALKIVMRLLDLGNPSIRCGYASRRFSGTSIGVRGTTGA